MLLFKNKSSLFYFTIGIVITISLSACHSNKSITKTDEKENPNASQTKKILTKYAQLLNVDENKIENKKLYFFIDDWYGIPYKYGGKNKNGIDCSNFTSALYNAVYKKTIIGSSASIFNECKMVSINNLVEGDLVFFKIENDNVSHIGVYLQNNKFVHATVKKGVMIDDLDEPYYKKYFFQAGRIK